MFDRHSLREYGDYAEKAHGLTPQSFVIPQIIEKTARGERMYDLFSRLMEDRIVIIGTPINDQISTIVVGQLLFLQKENKNLDISIYINSPGGSVTAGLAIYDTMQFVACDVSTCCVGLAASMGAILLAGGEKGKRYSLPHSRIMIHQPWGGIGGTAEDIQRQAQEVLYEKRMLNEILGSHTGRSPEQVEKDVDRDNFMSPTEAKEYGLLDDVITTLKKKKADGE
ncbi:MAG: ATP-dependent Clp protease proteolytic subunit [Planctomycetota bacterium]